MALRLPENVSIEEVIICYQVSNAQSFIAQVRLEEMNTPNQAIVIYDEPVVLNSVTPATHNSNVGGTMPAAGMAVNLALRMSFQNVTDQIFLGGIGVNVSRGFPRVAYVATVLGPGRTGILAVADNTTVGADVVFAQCCVNLTDGGDGGGGMFRWDSGSGTDDGGTIIVPGGKGIGSTGPCWRRVYNGAVNARWFGAQGDGKADDTCALQQALNFLMAIPHGGKLYIPGGVYKIRHTLTLVGDNAHNYVIEGDIGASGGSISPLVGSINTQLLWAGPPGCTMLDCWGINDSFFRHLTFNGGGQSLHINGSTVGILGAGCCTWFHTNQFMTIAPRV
jgi:hypothetical protein